MSFCPNLSDPIVNKQFNELVAATNNELAYLIWSLNKGNFLDKNPDGSNNSAFSILANKIGKYNALKEVGLALVDSNKVTKPELQELLNNKQFPKGTINIYWGQAVLDASVKTAHLKLVSTVIGQKGLLGARALITTFPSLDTYKELLGAVATYYTQDELRQIYNGNKKYINSFISEFEKPLEENTTGKNSSDYLDSNKINPDELASYTVKLALSALPLTDSNGQWIQHEQEKLAGLPMGTNYKESLDYLQKKLANTFSYEAQNKLFNEALLKRPNLRFLNNWFRFSEEVTTKDDLLLRTAFFNTFAKADVPFIIAVLGKEFRSFTPKTSREEDFLKKWESNMINSPVVSFDTAKNTYVLDVKKLKQLVETETQGATGTKITTNYYEFLKLLGYPESIKALTSSSAMEDVRFIKSQLTENIPIHEFFDKEGLKINKELLAITNAAVEASDVQESISIKDNNNNSRNSIGIPTALHLLFDQYKRGGLEYSLINNVPNNKMLKEIQAGNVEIVNLAQYKNDINTKQDFDSLDESGMAEAYANFLLDDMYPYLPSGDRSSEYAFKVKWSHDNLPTIKNLMGVIKDINGSVADRGKLKDTEVSQYGLPLFFGITTEAQLQTKITEEAASIKQNFERLDLKTKGIDFNEVALRYWYSFTQQGQLFTGDVTNFKDPFKRFTLFTSTRTAMINDQAFNDSLNKLYPRLDGKKADGFEKTVVLIDPTSNFPEMEKQFNISAKDYKDQKEIFDAAGAITLDAYREIMIKSDKWNEDWDTWYDYMANKSDKRPRVAGPILKTIYSGPLFDENNEAPENVYIPAAYKSAYKVLAPRTNNAEEQKMYDKMVDKQIGIALFKSGSKLQNLALQDMNAEEFTETQNISYDYMGFNLDTSGEEHFNVTFGTQSGKLLTVDLYGKNAPTTLNTRNGVKSKDEVINNYNTHIQELDALRRKTFLENLGLERTSDNKLQVRDGNYDRLVARIEQGLLARNTTSVTEYQVKEILRSREKLVDALAEKTKFENMIMSIFNSDVVKRNMPGEMLVQVPDLTGELKFYTKNEKGYTNLSEIRITLPKKLISYVKTLEGKNFSEKLATFNTMIAEGKVDKRILTLVPFRIPSQLQNAIEAVEIKAFLDTALGNTMEVPTGITVKVGSDFDVDKLTTYMPNFAITKEGLEYVSEPKDSSKLKAKIAELKDNLNFAVLGKVTVLNREERERLEISDEEYIELVEFYTNQIDEVEPELQKLIDEVRYLSAFSPKKVLENKVISDFIDILTSQELQENFLTPDSTDVLMSIGAEINSIYQKEKIDKADNTAKLSFNNIIKTRTNLLRFKSLVGQAALASTSHSLAQKAGLTYDNPELRGIYFTNWSKSSDEFLDQIISLDLIVNPVDGIKPSDIFKQFISASVDVSKEGNDYLVNSNVNERTFPVIQALIKAGVPLRDVMYFINQPILRELQEKLDRNNSIANLNKQKQSTVADKLMKTYELNRYYYTLKKSNNITRFSTSELKGMLTTTPIKDLTELQKKKQTEILYQYKMYSKTIAADMSELQQVTAVDTKQGGKSLAENLIRKINADNLIKKKVFGNLDKMFSETILKEQKVSADMAYDLWPNVFKFALHSTENGKKLLEKFFDAFDNALTTNKINALETLDRFLTAYILLTNEVKGKTSIGSFYTRLIEKGEAVKELIKMKDKYPDNPVIKQLVPMMPDNERATYNIKLFSRDYSAYEKETLIQGFEELMVDEPEFGKKLIMQQLLQSGVSSSMVSYQSILPKEYIEVTKDRLVKLAFIPEQVMKDFYETMWKNPNVLKSEFIVDYKGGKLYRKVDKDNPVKYLSIVAGEKVNGKNKKYLLKNTGVTASEGENIFTPIALKSNYPYGTNIGSINMNRGSDLYIPQSSTSVKEGVSELFESNPELQGNQQKQLNKFKELQERLNNKEFLEGAKFAYEGSESVKSDTRTDKNFANENEAYRVIVGDEAFTDILNSGVVRTNAGNKGTNKGDGVIDLSGRPTAFPSFSKGSASMSYAKDNPNHYIVVTGDASIQPSTSGRHGKGNTMFPTDESGKHLKELDGSKVKVYKHIGDGKYELAYANGKSVKNQQSLKDIGTQEQYNDYIARVSLGIVRNPSSGEFNSSAVKDIVYHGTKGEKFDKFKSSEKGEFGKGVYFGNYQTALEKTDITDDITLEPVTGFDKNKIISAIINTQNINIRDLGGNGTRNEYVVEPEQIHILGGKQDIQGFKEFVTQPSNSVKEGVSELFKSNPELANIGTQEQYSNYLDTIFPDSKVKDIVYRGGNLGTLQPRDVEAFTTNKSYAEYRAEQNNTQVYPAILNIQESKLLDTKETRTISLDRDEFQYQDYGFTNNKDQTKQLGNFYTVKENNRYILGNKQDIEGFKEFVTQPSTSVKEQASTTTTEESDSPFIEGESEIMSTFTKPDKAIEDAWNSLTIDQTKDLEKRKGIKSLQDFESAITDMITGGMTQEEALEDIKEC